MKYKKVQYMFMPESLKQITIKFPATLLNKIDGVSTDRQGRVDRSTTIRELTKERLDQL